MKRLGLGLLLSGLLVSGFGVPATANQSSVAGDAVASGEVIIRLSGSLDAAEFFRANSLSLLSPLGGSDDNTYLVSVDPFVALEKKIAYLASLQGVEYAEPNYVLELLTNPNDPDYSQLWGMGSGFGANATAAWSSGITGSSDVYVGVIDAGIDVTHPDLAANVWVNSAEANGVAGVDDDGNGFVDDVNGYDFLNNDGSVFDAGENYHGTHVAGTIGAVGNNGVGVAGVNWNVKLISAKFINSSGGGDTANAIRAIDYLTNLRTKQGIDIIATNNSYGGPQYSEAMNDAIRRGGDAGILFVAAAGNDSQNLETRNDFPSLYNCHTETRAWDCVVTVASSTTDGYLSSFSNYGSTRVDLAAPGSGIYSTMPNSSYGFASGTSMAAPHVTGALALCVAGFRGTSAERARQLLFENVKTVPALSGKVATGGVLDTGALVADCVSGSESFSGTPDLARASAIYTDRIRLDWDDLAGGEYEYQIQIASGPAGCTGTFSHYAFIGPGLKSYPIRGLDEAQFYCFRVRAIRDAAVSSWSVSNVAITWTSNNPFITGKVFLADGTTPVKNAMVKWQPKASSGSNGVVNSYTDTDGTYVLQVSAGTAGKLWLANETDPRKTQATPVLPLGLSVGGDITVSQDTLVNLTAPAQTDVTLRVVDGANVPNANASVYTERDTVYYCQGDSSYRPFNGASSVFCSFYPAGIKQTPPKTNASGELRLALPASNHYTTGPYRFTALSADTVKKVATVSVPATAGAQSASAVLADFVTLTGKTLTGSGANAGAATISWQPTVLPNNIYSPSVTSDSSGNYSISVPKGVNIKLSLGATDKCSNGCASIVLPLGLFSTGEATFNANSSVDLKGPATELVTIKVLEGTQPVAGATVRASREAVEYCDKASSYVPFTGAANRKCSFYIAGDRFSPPTTNSAGELKLPLPTSASYVRGTYSYNIAHPSSASRIVALNFAASSGSVQTATFNASVANITGVVKTSTGQPVSNVTVGFRASNQSNLVAAITTTTNAQGQYSLVLNSGTAGELYAENSGFHPSFEYALGPFASPGLPIGMKAGGVFTPTTDAVIDLTMPEVSKVTITAVDAYSETPIANAKIRTNRYTVVYCTQSGYKAFAAATSGVCQYWPLGANVHTPVTDAQGKIEVYLPLNSANTNLAEYVFTATHPFTNTRVAEGRVTVGSSADNSLRIVVPGTPSVPEQPTVTAGDSKVTLSWTEPWNGGAFIDYYQTWYSLSPQGPFARINSGSCAGNIPATQRSCVAEDLVPGVTYYFAIIAHNVVGASGLSVAIASIPTGQIPVGGALTDPNLAAISPVSTNPLTSSKRVVVRADGTKAEITAAPSADGKNLSLQVGTSLLSLAAPSGVKLAESGELQVAPGEQLSMNLAGFTPSSMVSVLLVPKSFYQLTVSEVLAANKVLVLVTGETDSRGNLSLSTQLSVPEGDYQLQIVGTNQTLALETKIAGFDVVPQVVKLPKYWTKKISKTAIKVYAENIVGVGKVRFVVNGKQVAFVTAKADNDPKLSAGKLVRTVTLKRGKNVIEIFVDKKRQKRVVYSR